MRRVLLISGAVLGVALLGACTSGSGNGKAAAGGARAPVANAPAHGAPTERAATDTSLRLDADSKIRTADLAVSIKGAANVAAKADEAGDIAVRAGGDVDSDDRTGGKHAAATLRLLVPPTRLRAVLAELSRLGTETSRSGSTVDVTGKVADVQSRVASAATAIARLRKLYDRAGKVSSVIAIEQELSTRESDLEALQAEQRALQRETGHATITLRLSTAAVPAPHPKSNAHHGFVGGLDHGWRAFVTGAGWLVTALGAALPFLVLLPALGIGLRLWRTRSGRRAAPD